MVITKPHSGKGRRKALSPSRIGRAMAQPPPQRSLRRSTSMRTSAPRSLQSFLSVSLVVIFAGVKHFLQEHGGHLRVLIFPRPP